MSISGKNYRNMRMWSVDPNSEFSLLKRSRPYTFKRFVRTTLQVLILRKRWQEEPQSYSDEEMKTITCCKRLRSIEISDFWYLHIKQKDLFQKNQDEMRRVLSSMLLLGRTYFFDEGRICNQFLPKEFYYSNDMRVGVRSAVKKQLRFHSTAHEVGGIVLSTVPSQASCSRPAVTSFFQRVTKNVSIIVPEKLEQHLPFFQRRQVYEIVTKDHETIYQSSAFSSSYSVQVWKDHCHSIKKCRYERFARCSIRKKLDAAMNAAIDCTSDTTELKKLKQKHIVVVSSKRQERKKKSGKTTLKSDGSRFIIVNGADQSVFCSRHFTSKRQDD